MDLGDNSNEFGSDLDSVSCDCDCDCDANIMEVSVFLKVIES